MTSRIRDYRVVVLIAFLAAITVNGLVIAWAFWYDAQRPGVELTLLSVENDTALCPGDTLDYDFVISVSKAASINLSTSEGNSEPNGIFSSTRLQQFDFDGKTDLRIPREWTLMPTYMDAVAGREREWPPGGYIQRTSATVVGGRASPSSIDVPFSVRADCP